MAVSNAASCTGIVSAIAERIDGVSDSTENQRRGAFPGGHICPFEGRHIG